MSDEIDAMKVKDLFETENLLKGTTDTRVVVSGFKPNIRNDVLITQATLTMDNAWHDLDLSAYFNSDAQAAILAVSIKDATIGTLMRFRRKGQSTNDPNQEILAQVANQYIKSTVIVPMAENRIIEYLVNATMDNIDISIIGSL